MIIKFSETENKSFVPKLFLFSSCTIAETTLPQFPFQSIFFLWVGISFNIQFSRVLLMPIRIFLFSALIECLFIYSKQKKKITYISEILLEKDLLYHLKNGAAAPQCRQFFLFLFSIQENLELVCTRSGWLSIELPLSECLQNIKNTITITII